MRMIRVFFPAVFFLALLPFCAHGGETGWSFLTAEGQCAPLAEMYKTYPETKGAASPEDVLRLLKESYPDATLQPFWDAVAAAEKQGDPAMDEKEKTFWKSIDTSNVFSLSVKSKGIDVGIMKQDTCKRVQGELKLTP